MKWLLNLIRLIIAWLFGPRPVTNLRVTFVTQTANLTWTDPAAPLTAVEVAMHVQGATDFTVLDTVAPGVQKLSVPSLADGDYTFRVVVINGKARSAGVTVTGTVSTPDQVPGDVTGMAVAFS